MRRCLNCCAFWRRNRSDSDVPLGSPASDRHRESRWRKMLTPLLVWGADPNQQKSLGESDWNELLAIQQRQRDDNPPSSDCLSVTDGQTPYLQTPVKGSPRDDAPPAAGGDDMLSTVGEETASVLNDDSLSLLQNPGKK